MKKAASLRQRRQSSATSKPVHSSTSGSSRWNSGAIKTEIPSPPVSWSRPNRPRLHPNPRRARGLPARSGLRWKPSARPCAITGRPCAVLTGRTCQLSPPMNGARLVSSTVSSKTQHQARPGWLSGEPVTACTKKASFAHSATAGGLQVRRNNVGCCCRAHIR